MVPRRVIVGVDASLGSLQALRLAVSLVEGLPARLIAVHVWPLLRRLAAGKGGVPALVRQEWEEQADRVLVDAFEQAMGGIPVNLPISLELLTGEPGPALVKAADREDDLLVIGRSRPIHRRGASPSVHKYCTGHAGCPVLVAASPPLEAHLRSLRWRLAVGGG